MRCLGCVAARRTPLNRYLPMPVPIRGLPEAFPKSRVLRCEPVGAHGTTQVLPRT